MNDDIRNIIFGIPVAPSDNHIVKGENKFSTKIFESKFRIKLINFSKEVEGCTCKINVGHKPVINWTPVNLINKFQPLLADILVYPGTYLTIELESINEIIFYGFIVTFAGIELNETINRP